MIVLGIVTYDPLFLVVNIDNSFHGLAISIFSMLLLLLVTNHCISSKVELPSVHCTTNLPELDRINQGLDLQQGKYFYEVSSKPTPVIKPAHQIEKKHNITISSSAKKSTISPI